MSATSNGIPDMGACTVDSYGREVRSIRISVTQRCDLRCSHCHREGQAPASGEMSASEIERLVSIASLMGIRKVKLTGGEPLLRDDIVEVIERISPAVSEVSMTTNGSRLESCAGDLRRAGLKRINVSLHSLNRDTYRRLCGVDIVDDVVKGIESAVRERLSPVKVNMVVIKDLNDRDIPSMVDFCSRSGAVLQLIEYMSGKVAENGCGFSDRFYSLESVERTLSEKATGVTLNELHRRKRYSIPNNGREAIVEVVRPMHNSEFCSNCSRIRMSSDGKLKPCLMDSSGTVDILTPLREGADDASLKRVFMEAVSNRRPYWS